MYIRNYASRKKWPQLRSASEFGFNIGGEENAAAPHFPPLHTKVHLTVTERRLVSWSNQVEVNFNKIWLLAIKRIHRLSIKIFLEAKDIRLVVQLGIIR